MLQSREDWKTVFVLSWTAIWLYLSLSMVVVSFGAIQFQGSVWEEFHVPGGTDFHLTVAQIKLDNDRYILNKTSLAKLSSEPKTSNTDKPPSVTDTNSVSTTKIYQLTTVMYPKLFNVNEPIPNDVIAKIKEKCASGTKDNQGNSIKDLCDQYNNAINTPPAVSPPTTIYEVRNEASVSGLETAIATYEDSSAYSAASELDSYKRLAGIIIPWMPSDVLLPALPPPTLALIVTLSMGALGSVLFMLQLHLATLTKTEIYKSSISWHLFRPLQGMATALAIFLLVKAGQISISHTTGPNAGQTLDINPFVLGFLGVIAGLLSDRAMESLSAAGINFLRVSRADEDDTVFPC